MKKRLLSLLLIAFFILTDIAPVITVAAEELAAPDEGAAIESMESIEDPSAEEDVSVEEEVPAEEDVSVEEEVPAEEDVSVEEETPAEEDVSVEEEAPAEEDVSVEEETPAEEEVLAEESITQELMMTSATTYTYEGFLDTSTFTDDASGDGWEWDHETRTLTITDLTIDVSGYDDYAGIYIEDATLVSAGSGNKIIGDADNWAGFGYYGDVTITGSAPLTITGSESGICSDGSKSSLTIDGTPITISDTEYALYAQTQLMLNGGSYVATPGVEIIYEDGHYFAAKDGDYATELEFAVADKYIDLTTLPDALYAGKANDNTMAVTLAVGATVVGSSDPLTYQWYSCDDYSGTNPVAISGATSATYTFGGSHGEGDYFFYCEATAGTLTRDFPVSRVALTSTGVIPFEGNLSLFYDDPAIDRLNVYGYKWDPTTLTLTLKNANVAGVVDIYGDEDNPKDITIELAEGSVNSISRTTPYSVLCAGSGSKLNITGAGTLNITRTNTTTRNNKYAVIHNDCRTLVVGGGAQVNLYNNGKIKYGAILSPNIQVTDTAVLTLNNTTTDLDVTKKDYAVGAYQNLVSTSITTPASYTTESDSGYYYIKDAAGYATQVVFEANSEPTFLFTAYPAATVDFPRSTTSVTLNALAEAYNIPDAVISYQWYMNGEAVAGATASSFTFDVTPGIYPVRCDATATAGGETYNATGEEFMVLVGVYTGQLSISDTTASVDRLEEYGYKWDLDTKTLTLDNLVQYSAGYNAALNVLTDLTVVLAEGSTNVLNSSTYNGLFIRNDYTMTVTGNGKLIANSLAPAADARYGINLYSGAKIVLMDGAKLETNTNASVGVYAGSSSGCSFRIIGEGSEFTANCAEGGKAFYLYNPVIGENDFVISEPEGGKLNKSGSYVTSTDSLGNAVNHFVLGPSTAPYFSYTSYPNSVYTLPMGETVTLNASAALYNFEGSVSIKYQWYLNGEAISGATASSYTMPAPAQKGRCTLRCDAAVTAGGTTYSLTGKNIVLKYGGYYNTVGISPTTASVDNLETYGWKWDKDTATLTLKNAYIDPSSYGIRIQEGFTAEKPLTIAVPEGTHSVVYGGTGADALDIYSHTVITGKGTLELRGTGTRSLNGSNATSAELTLAGGVQLLINHQKREDGNTSAPITFYSNAVLRLKDKGTKLISKAVGDNSTSLRIEKFANYTPEQLADYFLVTVPASYKMSANGTLCHSNGSVYYGDLVLEADANHRLTFTAYPEASNLVGKGESIVFTAQAKAKNFTNANPTVTYTWYKEDGTKLGTGASYTYKPAAGINKLYCVASATDEGVPVSVTGKIFSVACGIYSEKLDLRTKTNSGDSMDRLAAYGWKWDAPTRTLTLKNAAFGGGIWLPVDSTVYVTPGTVNTISVTTDYCIYANGTSTTHSLNIEGDGKLILEKSASTNYYMIYANNATLNLIGVDMELTRTAFNHNSLIVAYGGINYRGAAVSLKTKSTAAIDLTTYGTNFFGTKLVKGTLNGNVNIRGEYDAATGYCEALLEPSGWYVAESPEKIIGTSVGLTEKLTVKAEVLDSTKLTYQWYTTEDYSSPIGDSTTLAIAGATSATLSVKANQRGMLGYYFCVVSDGTESFVTPVSAVIAGAKGKLPITQAIDPENYETEQDYLASHGWKWEPSTQTLTLSNAEVYIPFTSGTTWFNPVEGENTIVLAENTLNNAGAYLIYDTSDELSLTIKGGGELIAASRLFGFSGNLDTLTITQNAHVSTDYIDHTALDAKLVVSDGGTLDASMDPNRTSYFYGDILVDNGAVHFDCLYNYDTDAAIVVKNGGLFRTHNDRLEFYGNEVTVEEGATMMVDYQLRIGNSTTGQYGEAKLTVGGTLLVTGGGIPLFIYTTLSGEEAFVVNGNAKVIAPVGHTIVNGTVEGEKQLAIGNSDGTRYYGTLFIGPADYQAIPLEGISMVGTPKYGERLQFVTDPEDAVIERYEVQYSYSKDGPWEIYSVGSSAYMDVTTKMVDRYLRVVATAIGTHSGTAISNVIGPVEGDPNTLKALYIDDDGWDVNEFNGANTSWSQTRYVTGLEEEITARYWAVPVSEDAVVTMKVVNEEYPDGVAFEGAVADLPLVLGDNTVTVTVTNGESVKAYTVEHEVRLDSTNFLLRSSIEGAVVTAKLEYPDGTEETYVADDPSGDYIGPEDSVPLNTRITLSATVPEGMRVWSYAYYGNALYAGTEAPYTCTYYLAEYSGSVDLRSSGLIAMAPEITGVYWDNVVDGDGTSTAYVEVEALSNTNAEAGSYPYYDILVEIFNEAGEEVAECSTKENEAAPGAGESSVLCIFEDLDPTENYTVRAYYTELYGNAYYLSEAGYAAQFAVCELEAVPTHVALIPSTEHMVLAPGQSGTLTFEFDGMVYSYISLAESSDAAILDFDDVIFDGDDYKKATISVPDDAEEGTVWLTFAGTLQNVFGVGYRYSYATVRLDVAEETDIDAVHLGETSGSLNLFDDSVLTIPVYGMDVGYEIIGAAFEEAETAAVFDIEVINDRTIRVVPKDKAEEDTRTWAQWGKELSGSYSSPIKVAYRMDGETTVYADSEEALSIKLTAKAPAVKATTLKLNSFFRSQRQALEFTTKDGAVERVVVDESKTTAKAPACPVWLTLNEDMTVTLNSAQLVNKKGSGKLNVEVWLEGYRAPAQVAVSVSAAYTAPKLKLTPNSVSLAADKDYQSTVELQLLSSDKKVDFASLDVTDIRIAAQSDLAMMSEKDRKTYAASSALQVYYFDSETGVFSIDSYENPVSGKAAVVVTFGGDAEQTVVVPLTVKVLPQPKLKADTTKVTLNAALGFEGFRDEKEVVLSSDAAGYSFSYYDSIAYVVTDKSGEECSNGPAVSKTYGENGYDTLCFYVSEDTEVGEYKVTVTVDGIEKPVVISVSVKETVPKLKLGKSSITLNRALGVYDDEQSVAVTTSDANYDFDLHESEVRVIAPDGEVLPIDQKHLHFYISSEDGIETLHVSPYLDAQVGTYKMQIDHRLPNGDDASATLTVKVADKLPTIKPSSKTITLFKDTAFDGYEVVFSGLEDYYANSISRQDDAGAEVYNSNLGWDDEIRFYLGSNAEAGKTYKVNVVFHFDYDIESKPVALTVKVVDTVTATASVKGNPDLTRPNATAAAFTFKYNGWNPEEYSGSESPLLKWEVYAKNGKTDIGDIGYGVDGEKGTKVAYGERYGNIEDNENCIDVGWFRNIDTDPFAMKLALNEEDLTKVNPRYTYMVYITLTFRDIEKVVECKPVKLTVKQGSTKFAADVKAVTLSKLDRYDRAVFELYSTDKDAENVMGIAKVAADSDIFQIKETVSGKYVICWKNNAVPDGAKGGSVKLNIWLEGNYVDGCEALDAKDPGYRKPNGTVSLNINVK